MEPQAIENIYPLSPMQQGMLFHTLYAPSSGVYFEQMTCELEGGLDPDLFAGAWQRVLDRHGVLRTAFDWQNADEPVQVVLRGVELPLRQEDWRALAAAERRRRLETFLREDRERGFDLAAAPLLRLALLRTGERRYRLVWSHHHLLLDGWSMAILFAEFFAIYAGLERGEEVRLPRPRPFIDYIAWLSKRDLGDAEDFWRRALAGFPAATPLALERPRARELPDRERQGVHQLFLDAATTAAIHEHARRHRVTPSTWLLGAWALLLGRHAGEDDVVFGSVVAGRPPELPGVEEMVGLFLNTLPVRLRLDSEAAFVDWIRQAQGWLQEARRHEHAPLARVQGWSDVPRGQPLFESLYVYENYPITSGGSDGADLDLELHDYRVHEQTDLPLTLVVQPGDRLRLELKIDRRRFGGAAADEILAQLARLVERSVEDPGRTLESFDLLTPAALARQPDPSLPLASLVGPEAPWIGEMLRRSAAAHPEAPAVEQAGGGETRTLSYGRLLDGCSTLSRDLRAAGLGDGTVVAVSGDRSFGLVVASLAVLLAGGTLTLLEPRLAAARRRRTLELAGAKALLWVGDAGEPPGRAAAEGVPATIWALDPATGLPAGRAAESAPEGPWPAPGGEAAYVVFTSGTLGEPKGIRGAHRGLAHFLAWQRDTFGLGPGDRFAQLTGLSFDVVLRDLFAPLVSGATLCLPPRSLDVVSHRLPDWLAELRITGLHTVPSVAQAWLAGHGEKRLGASLSRAFFAGEALGEDLVRSFVRVFGGPEVVNLYGPSETTLAKCCFRVAAEPEPGTQPIGRPIPGAQAWIEAPSGRRCGLGEPGEIVLRTPYRSLGYLEDGAPGSDRFAADGCYFTGDRGRLRLDGEIEILGRLDDQVKIRGVRVEPEGVAALLRRHPDVEAAAVVLRNDAPAPPRLVAYAVPSPRRAATAGGRPRYVLPNNLAVVHLNKNETDYLYREIFELQAYLRHGITLDAEPVVLDVGANVGLFHLFVHLLAPGARIVSCEPNPVVFDLLERNAALYGTGGRLLRTAVGAEPGRAEFTFFPGFSMLSGFHTDVATEKETITRYMAEQRADAGEPMEALLAEADAILDSRFEAEVFPVEVRTLSQVMAGESIERVDLLKINVEKSELDVLRGIAERDWPQISQVVLEVDTEANLGPIAETLEKRGFDVVVMQDSLLRGTALRYVYGVASGGPYRLVREQRGGDHRVPLVPLAEPFLAAEELSSYAHEHLPEAAVPAAFVMLDALPLTANGKLDRAALPAPESGRQASRRPYVAPRDRVELELVQIWEDILGTHPVGVLDDFFELGGHSLLIAPLAGRIERQLGRVLSLSRLFQAPTVERLALALRADGQGAGISVVTLQGRGHRPPLFCAHPLGGSPLCYHALARRLGDEQPLYGFDALHARGDEPLPASFQAMAAEYLDGMRRIQPRGPYHLAGWSFGGLVAFEVACQLRRQGEEVALLAVIDAQLPRFGPAAPVDDATVIERILGPDLGLDPEELRRLEPEARLEHLVRLGKKTRHLPPDYDVDSARHVLRVVHRHGAAIQAWKPAVYDRTITFFQAATDEGERTVDEAGIERWRELTRGGLDLRAIRGPHRELVFEPWVEGLAQELEACLAEAGKPVATMAGG